MTRMPVALVESAISLRLLKTDPLPMVISKAKPTTPQHLLIVDDEAPFREIMKRLLERSGFQVSLASSGLEAITSIASGLAVDMILIDQRMPNLTGTETFHRLRSDGIQTPIILVSAMADVQDVAKAHGFNAALEKPLSLDALIQTIRTIL